MADEVENHSQEDEGFDPEEHLPWLREVRRQMGEETEGMDASEEAQYYNKRGAEALQHLATLVEPGRWETGNRNRSQTRGAFRSSARLELHLMISPAFAVTLYDLVNRLGGDEAEVLGKALLLMETAVHAREQGRKVGISDASGTAIEQEFTEFSET